MELINRRQVLIVSIIDIVAFIVSLSLDVSLANGVTDNQGIWCGLFYLVAGVVGLVIIFYKKDRSIVQGAVLGAILACVFGLVCAGLSGQQARNLSTICTHPNFSGIFNFCYYSRMMWSLMVISILTAINNVILAYLLYPNIQSASPQSA